MSWSQVFQSNPIKRALDMHETQLLYNAFRLTMHDSRVRNELLHSLGTTYRGKVIPKDFSTVKTIDGVQFRVYSSTEKSSRAKQEMQDYMQGRGRKPTHTLMRAFVICPIDNKEISIGRMHQHAEVHVSREVIRGWAHELQRALYGHELR